MGRKWTKEKRKRYSKFMKDYYKTHNPWNKGLKTQTNTGRTHFKEGHIPWNKGLKGFNAGEKHYLWKGGKENYWNDYQRKYRHKLGTSKKYITKYGGTTIPLKFYRQQRKALERAAGPLTIQTIQLVYEDNIKKYKTLTCIYCLKPIPFGKDALEHKIPLSRGGTNEYNNLAIACQKCNSSKGKKTEEEYRKEIFSR